MLDAFYVLSGKYKRDRETEGKNCTLQRPQARRSEETGLRRVMCERMRATASIFAHYLIMLMREGEFGARVGDGHLVTHHTCRDVSFVFFV